MVTVCASGFFNPLTKGHVRYLKAARALGDLLYVIINNDRQVKLKGSVPFMGQDERLEIVSSIVHVNVAIISIDDDLSVNRTLDIINSNCERMRISPIGIFANGGDTNHENFREKEMCERLGIKPVFGVGGNKVQSSSYLLQKVIDKYAKL
jgi:D-beta-D-heptose 7-phosphate kinase/D-beta-D-heptose 1-phosphate adenosyltransferase